MTKANKNFSGVLDLLRSGPARAYKMYAVGGYVRDVALGIEPNDLDILIPDVRIDPDCAGGGSYCGWLSTLIPDAKILVTTGDVVRCKLLDLAIDIQLIRTGLWQNLAARDFDINSQAISLSTGSMTGDSMACFANDEIELNRSSESDNALVLDPRRVLRAIRLRQKLTDATGRRWRFGPRLAKALEMPSNKLIDCATCLQQNSSSAAVIRNEMVKTAAALTAGQFVEAMSDLGSGLREAMLYAAETSLSFKQANVYQKR